MHIRTAVNQALAFLLLDLCINLNNILNLNSSSLWDLSQRSIFFLITEARFVKHNKTTAVKVVLQGNLVSTNGKYYLHSGNVCNR